MWNGTYKKILEGIPSGVFVFDSKMRVKYTNAAFRRSFSDLAKPKGALSQTLGCQENCACGEGRNCGYCSFYRIMQAVIRDKTEKKETFKETVQRNGRTACTNLRRRPGGCQKSRYSP